MKIASEVIIAPVLINVNPMKTVPHTFRTAVVRKSNSLLKSLFLKLLKYKEIFFSSFGTLFAYSFFMSRINRQDYLFDGCVVHARLQINNGEFHFQTKAHFNLWKKITLRYLKKYPSVRLTGYQWMSNHCHLTLEADKTTDLSRFMHDLSWRFAFTFNKLHKRKGHLFQNRFRCSVIDKNEYEQTVQRYIYQNQIRAGMVKHVRHTRWSSYPFYAYGKADPLITPFRTYGLFGAEKKVRMLQFRNFVETQMDHEDRLWQKKLVHPHLKTKKEVLRNYLMKSGYG